MQIGIQVDVAINDLIQVVEGLIDGRKSIVTTDDAILSPVFFLPGAQLLELELELKLKLEQGRRRDNAGRNGHQWLRYHLSIRQCRALI
ncbi:hypothetical protein VSDG_08406 [Cytospora chrysosperma]|uniref:Uncharacterized protein n=1 Tax=Cytospora chrysosperma TaxID=252740 RepID=A0A423VGI8_CYTCH|nr:hypothetical protein VSDG_08406 [Valsa sordida]